MGFLWAAHTFLMWDHCRLARTNPILILPLLGQCGFSVGITTFGMSTRIPLWVRPPTFPTLAQCGFSVGSLQSWHAYRNAMRDHCILSTLAQWKFSVGVLYFDTHTHTQIPCGTIAVTLHWANTYFNYSGMYRALVILHLCPHLHWVESNQTLEGPSHCPQGARCCFASNIHNFTNNKKIRQY